MPGAVLRLISSDGTSTEVKMKKYNYALAIDIGASSGRHIVGWMDHGLIQTEEVYRFPNGVKEEDGVLVWDIVSLEAHVRQGISRALEKYPAIKTLSIDTWGVDYVLLKGDEPILPCLSYRNGTTDEVRNKVHSLISFEELYARTGIQFQPFNTIYQLYRDKMSGKLEEATDFLMIPEYLLYRLCGVKSHEYTNATTGGMVNAESGEYDQEILRRLAFPRSLFHPLDQPGKILGSFKGISCMLCATHDTSSAIEGIPMEGDALFLSSGTWSLIGAKTDKAITTEESCKANCSNEGGAGYNCYLKNIMGMWLVNELKKEVAPKLSFDELVKEAEKSTFSEPVDVNDASFLAPKSMKEALLSKLSATPKNVGDCFKAVFLSLAESYSAAVEELEHNTGKTYSTLYIVGGGAKNGYLNRLTEEKSGKKVIALPIEATAIGNLRIQLETDR